MGIYGRTVRVFGIAALGLSLAAAQANAESAIKAPASVSSELSQIHIFNFGKIDEGYYRGGELKGSDAADLAKLGVKTVIDLRSDSDYEADEARLVSSAHMNYIRIPMTTRVAPTVAQIEKFLSIVRDPASQPVYVHCVEGRHRTGVMTAVYRMTVDGWNADRAFDEMKQYKFGMAMLHPEFKKFVYAYRPAPAMPVEIAAPTPVANPVPAAQPAVVAAVAATN